MASNLCSFSLHNFFGSNLRRIFYLLAEKLRQSTRLRAIFSYSSSLYGLKPKVNEDLLIKIL